MKAIALQFELKKPILACGADLKGAFALAKGPKAYLYDGFGDLADPDNLARYEKAVKVAMSKLGIRPALIACDLHPDYFSTRFAESCRLSAVSCQLVKVQHHEAHVASAIADNLVKGDVIGVAFDGTGFGSDGNIWGGEFFAGNPARLRREAHFEYVPMPGGESAIRQPWRMAASLLYKAFGNDFIKRSADRGRVLFIKTMMDKSINSPLTSSAGRIFDAAASLILGKEDASFEAQLPIELEKMAPDGYEERYAFDTRRSKGVFIIYMEKAVKGIVKDLAGGVDRRLLSGRFHNTMAEIVAKMVFRLSKKYALDKVVLTGGVFQNKYLSKKVRDDLMAQGFKVYSQSKVSINDSGIPLGQIAIAAARARCV